jgi:pyruvate dehydrogenase E2 component (dihydrolipoamide acetyltransferase)
MATLLTMPKLGLTMTEGTIGEWYKKEGDTVEVGDLLYQLETDKLTNDIEAKEAGVLRKILLQSGEEAECFASVGIIAASDEDISDLLSGNSGAEAPAVDMSADAKAAPAVEISAEAVSPGGRIIASPAAKKLARTKEIDITLIKGTGPNGRITLEDVEKYVPAAASASVKASPVAHKVAEELGVDVNQVPGSGRVMKADVLAFVHGDKDTVSDNERKPMSTMRKVISKRMTESWTTCPTVTYDISVDMTALTAIKDSFKDAGVKVSHTDLLVYVVANTLSEFPLLNCSIDGNDIIYHHYVNMGVAVAVSDGLVVPVIKHAHAKKVSQISSEFKILAQEAKDGRLTPDNMTGGTFTITNLGMLGIEAFSPIVNLPEVAILGVNAIIDTVISKNGTFVVRPLMKLSLSADHRAVDGAVAAQFLAALRKKMENPALLML